MDWYTYYRDVCLHVVQQIPNSESKFGKWKYNRSHLVEGKWVLGGIFHETKGVFFVEVAKRDLVMLIPLFDYKICGCQLHGHY